MSYPELPPDDEWPPHMIGDSPIKASLRETFAKISWQTHANRTEEAEKNAAIAWCRTNGNPHISSQETPA